MGTHSVPVGAATLLTLGSMSIGSALQGGRVVIRAGVACGWGINHQMLGMDGEAPFSGLESPLLGRWSL